jgi:hypothetical protein
MMAGSINNGGPPPYNRAIHNLQSPNKREGVMDRVYADILKSGSSDIGIVKYYLYRTLGDARP